MLKLTQADQTLHKQLVRLSSMKDKKEELLPAINHNACELVKNAFNSFTSDNSQFYKIALKTMMEKICQDCMKTALTLDKESECNALANILMEQMKSNASIITCKKGGI